ncbi:hypothetical protein GALMADRAFT_128644, partial [Galerina marginata CBS 339.88]
MDSTPPRDPHPLALELQSLRASVARFQDEAHTASLKLQHHALASARTHERAGVLERENEVLRGEVRVLRAYPLASSSLAPSLAPSSLSLLGTSTSPSGSTNTDTQIQELTLSLRRLSHKLSLTESTVLSLHTTLATTQSSLLRASTSTQAAYALGAKIRGREEDALGRVRELEEEKRALEGRLGREEGVVRAYAEMVRGMEGRGRGSFVLGKEEEEEEGKRKTDDLTTSLQEQKTALEEKNVEFREKEEALHRKLSEVQAELEVCRSELEAERKAGVGVQSELGRARAEVDRMQAEDGSAAKMVARYM